jgi:CubicO group peptidase (beta-lactamase class C family)
MKKALTIIILILAAAVAAIAQETRPTAAAASTTTKPLTTAELSRELEAYVDQLVAEDKFSGTILLAKDGAPFFKKAYGLASKGYNVPVRLDTKFNLGSMNKMFTSVAIAQLVEQGKLAYTDTVAKLLPDYPNKEVAAKVTVHHLLTHTSGLGNYFNSKFMETAKDKFRAVSDYLPLFTSKPLLFEPGARWQYSNAGFMLLGAIVEKVSGQNYFDYVREHIYQPAGMTNTDAYEMDSDTPNMATGYTKRGPQGPAPDGKYRTNLFLHSFKGGPAGGGFSTVEDLLRFATALNGHKLLSEKYTDLITTGKVKTPGDVDVKYAYGFEDEMLKGHRRFGHGGGFPGINSELRIFPDLGYTVAVMSNYDPPAASRIAERVSDLMTGGVILQPTALTADALQKYAGRYEAKDDGGRVMTIDATLRNNQLWLQVGPGRHKFLPLSDTEFYDEEYPNVRLTFSKDAPQGQAASFVLKNAGPTPLTARRVALPAPSLKGNTTFRLKGFPDAQIVALAGSFNNWNPSQTLFAREGNEWVSRVDLAPGKQTYKFIVDGEWMVDPNNPLTEDDGSGNINSVLVVKAQ